MSGKASGTTPMLSRMAVSDFSCLFCLSSPQLTADHGHGDGHDQDPTCNAERIYRNPEKLENGVTQKREVSNMIATDRLAVRLVLFLAAAVW